MTIRHHPSDETILRYSNGSLSAPLSIVVRAHLDVCGTCRETAALAETMGGAFLEFAAPVEMSTDALSRVLAQLDAPAANREKAPPVRPRDGMALPPALQPHTIGTRRWLAPGIWARPIMKDRTTGTRAYLLGAEAGKALPHHGHQGMELTQVLQGEFFDGGVRYGPGDFFEADGQHEHRPVVGANEPCICVIASEGVPRGFVGLLMRVFT